MVAVPALSRENDFKLAASILFNCENLFYHFLFRKANNQWNTWYWCMCQVGDYPPPLKGKRETASHRNTLIKSTSFHESILSVISYLAIPFPNQQKKIHLTILHLCDTGQCLVDIGSVAVLFFELFISCNDLPQFICNCLSEKGNWAFFLSTFLRWQKSDNASKPYKIPAGFFF